LEAHPYPVKLLRNGTYFRTLQCAAAFDDKLPKSYRKLVREAARNDSALVELQEYILKQNPNLSSAKLGTTQAIDLIGGGVKVNALPEHVWAVANHRIADWRYVFALWLTTDHCLKDNHSSLNDVHSHYIDVLSTAASKLNFTFDAFGSIHAPEEVKSRAAGLVRVSDVFDIPLEPAPVTPTFGSSAWELLSGTIKSTISSALRSDREAKSVYVGPELSTGNTGESLTTA
jgi:Gly-Xaa carboxypeptidase